MRKLKITELNRLTVDEFKKADKLPLAVVLDEVRSLHNIGSVFRTSDAFLVDCIYLCRIFFWYFVFFFVLFQPLLPIPKCIKQL